MKQLYQDDQRKKFFYDPIKYYDSIVTPSRDKILMDRGAEFRVSIFDVWDSHQEIIEKIYDAGHRKIIKVEHTTYHTLGGSSIGSVMYYATRDEIEFHHDADKIEITEWEFVEDST